jgi:surface antigen
VTNSTQTALETGAPTTWTGDTGASGANRVVPTEPAILQANPGKICRTVEQNITLADGSAGVQKLAACKGDDGAWQAVSK